VLSAAAVLQAVVRGKAHDGGLKGATMALVVTHEFVL
jgi:hypothetical protein